MNNGVIGVRMESATNRTVGGTCEVRPQIYRLYERVAGPQISKFQLTASGFTYSTHYNSSPIAPRLAELIIGLRSSRLDFGQAIYDGHIKSRQRPSIGRHHK